MMSDISMDIYHPIEQKQRMKTKKKTKNELLDRKNADIINEKRVA